MSRFYVGQKVVCLKIGPWKWNGKIESDGPVRNEVCTVTDLEYDNDKLFLELAEFGNYDVYDSICFRPIDECDQGEDLTRELATQFLERIVHEEIDIIPNKQHAAQ